VSTTSFAAALGLVTNRFIGRTEDPARRRLVAEAETIPYFAFASSRVPVSFGLGRVATGGNIPCSADAIKEPPNPGRHVGS